MTAEVLKKYFNNKNRIVYDLSFGILGLVDPLKRCMLQYLLSRIPDGVEFLLVFGSSVTGHQRVDSDLDLVVIPDANRTNVRKILREFDKETSLDLIGFDSFEEIVRQASEDEYSACADILLTGVPIFVRGIAFHVHETDISPKELVK
jgi:predicted nucleotidyltransferase